MENPYKIEPYGFAPIQASGLLPNGHYYYIRSRSMTSIEICETEEDWWDNKYLYEGYDDDLEYLEPDQLIAWATEHIDKYLNEKL